MVFQIRNNFSDFDRVILKTIDEFNSTEMQTWKTDANVITKVASKKNFELWRSKNDITWELKGKKTIQIFRKKNILVECLKKDVFGRFHTLLDSRMRLQNASFGKTKHKRVASTHAS